MKLPITDYSLLTRRGFSPVEVILAGSILALIVTAVVGALVYGREGIGVSGSRARAIFLAEEGLEVVRNLRDETFGNLVDGPHGIATSGSQWVFLGVQDATDIFTRAIQVGTIDSKTKQITSTVTWQINLQRTGQIALSTRLTNWRAPVGAPKGGILVYGDGGTTSDSIRYRILDGVSGTWSASSTAADIDVATTNRALRAVQVYASPTRNEKVMISRHYNGSNQFIYAQVFDGSSWGSVQLLSSWAATNFLDVQNFSGTYLANGDFMVVYRDGTTTIPKFRVWNGTSWTGQISMQNIGGIPNYVVIKARLGTNEVMAAFFDQSSDTNSQYFNGGAYVLGSWTTLTEHATAAPVNTKALVDFAWSPTNPLKGALIFANAAADTTLTLKIWTANGAGGGSWSGVVNSAAGGQLGAMAIDGRVGAEEFLACEKDVANDIRCFRGNVTPAWATPTNNILTTTSHTGIQRSFDLAYEAVSGNLGLAVYSDNTVTPKYRKYNPITNAFDAAASSITVSGGGVLTTVRLIPQPDTDDIMILMADANNDMRSIVWDGTSDALYTTPSGKALNLHGINGVANTHFWFDFAWDKF